MEQKQLDEIDESYFGEEFIDEVPFEEVTIEGAKKKVTGKKANKSVSLKKTSPKKNKIDQEEWEVREVKDKIEKKIGETAVEFEESVAIDDPVVEIIKDDKKETKKNETKKENEPVSRTPLETPVNPWSDEEGERGIFGEASTWKAITGILLILLVFSIFTGGFKFSEGATGSSVAVPGEELSLQEAKSKVLDFVNDYLLQPPFVAEIVDSKDHGNLYVFTLDVAGQVVDSYLTKDGKLFFPQGISTNPEDLELFSDVEKVEKIDLENVEEAGLEEEVELEELLEDAEVKELEESEEAEEVEVEPVETFEETKTITLSAKKWLFTPDIIKVNVGDAVKLTIDAEGLDFTFAIPKLGVEEKVQGITEVTFNADEAGSFEFKCSSCEDWRGMTGTLLVR